MMIVVKRMFPGLSDEKITQILAQAGNNLDSAIAIALNNSPVSKNNEKWSNDPNTRRLLLQKRKQEMLKKARKRFNSSPNHHTT